MIPIRRYETRQGPGETDEKLMFSKYDTLRYPSAFQFLSAAPYYARPGDSPRFIPLECISMPEQTPIRCWKLCHDLYQIQQSSSSSFPYPLPNSPASTLTSSFLEFISTSCFLGSAKRRKEGQRELGEDTRSSSVSVS